MPLLCGSHHSNKNVFHIYSGCRIELGVTSDDDKVESTVVIVLAADLMLGNEPTTDIPLDTEADVTTEVVRLAANVRTDDVKLTTGILIDSVGLGEDEIKLMMMKYTLLMLELDSQVE